MKADLDKFEQLARKTWAQNYENTPEANAARQAVIDLKDANSEKRKQMKPELMKHLQELVEDS